MFRNLEAEQARRQKSNSDVAELLGISRASYERKKKTGNFNRAQIVELMKIFDCDFNYLFDFFEEEVS